MSELQNWVPGLDRQWLWVLQVFLILLATGFASFFLKRVLARLLHRFGKTETQWDDMIIDAMRKPVTWGVWIIGIAVAIELVYSETETALFAYADSVRDVGVLLCLTWFLLNLVRGAEGEFTRGVDSVDQHTAEAIGKLVRLAVVITAGLVILQTLGFSISGVLAMGGLGGIAIGFAARDLLANFFGALIIYLDRPFAVGDWIRSPDRSIEGTVEKIGWRVTVIRNFESRPLYVPNSVFTNVIVENPSRMNNRRIYENIGLRYADLDRMDQVVAEVETMLRNHEAIDTNQTLMVNFIEFADSSLDFMVYCFTKTTRWVEYHQKKQEIMLRIAEIIEAHGAEIAFPTTTLHIADPVTLES